MAVEFRPDGHADLGRCPHAGALAANLGLDARQRPLGRRQQFPTLAGPLVGQQRVAANDQALAGKLLGGADLRHVALVEQRELKRAAFGRQLLDRRCAQAGDPVEPRRLQFVADARVGDHAAVADDDHASEPEACPELGDLLAQRRRIAGIAGKHLDRHRQAVPIAKQAIDDLRPIPAMVAAIAEACQLTLAPFQIG